LRAQVFYDAKDAAAFCLQAQQLLSQQKWPNPSKLDSLDEQLIPLASHTTNPVYSSNMGTSSTFLSSLSKSKNVKPHSSPDGMPMLISHSQSPIRVDSSLGPFDLSIASL